MDIAYWLIGLHDQLVECLQMSPTKISLCCTVWRWTITRSILCLPEQNWWLTIPPTLEHATVHLLLLLLGECKALWGERKKVVLCGRSWCVCKWNNSKHVYEETDGEQRASARILLNLYFVCLRSSADCSSPSSLAQCHWARWDSVSDT